jgi:hypothetical protein
MKKAESTQASSRPSIRIVPTGMWRLFQDRRTASLWSVRGRFGGLPGMMLSTDPEPRTTLARVAMRAVRQDTEGLTQCLPYCTPASQDSEGLSQIIGAGEGHTLVLAPVPEGCLLLGHRLTPALQLQGMEMTARRNQQEVRPALLQPHCLQFRSRPRISLLSGRIMTSAPIRMSEGPEVVCDSQVERKLLRGWLLWLPIGLRLAAGRKQRKGGLASCHSSPSTCL